MKVETAIILATDWSNKFYPFTETKPKHLIHVASKPLINRIIDQLANKNIKNIIIVLQAKDHITKQKILINRDKTDPDVDLKFIYTKDPIGTADVLEKILPMVEASLEGFLVFYSDILVSDWDLENFLTVVERGNGDAFVLVDKVNNLRANDWICAEGDGELGNIVFHPRRGAKYRVCGIFAFNGKVNKFLEITPTGTTHAPTGVMLSNERFLEETVALMIDHGEKVVGVDVKDFVVDIDKPWHVLEANEKYLEYLSKNIDKSVFGENVHVSEKAEIKENIILGDEAKIGPNAVIEDFAIIGSKTEISNAILQGKVSIGSNSRIGEFSKIWKYTSIGSNVRVLHCAEVAGVIMDKVSIMHHAYVHGVIGESVDIGAGTVTGDLRFNDLPPIKYTDNRREQENPYMNGVFIGDYVRLGINVSINPGVRIGPYTVIGPGVVLNRDVEPRKKVLVKQDFSVGDWNEKMYGF
ncbi:MAG: sugar phosphate nucleotidyltransferase [Candidatus Njordarchaeia archaeon]